jgi:hypothetical protein
MNLRPSSAFRRPHTWRVALLTILALTLLSVGRGPGDAAAGLADYSAPLYLSGAAATLVSGSNYTLVNAAGPATALAKPTVALVAGGSLAATTTYSYEFSVVDSNGVETPVGASISSTTTAVNKSVNVGGLPTGVRVRLYRQTGVATNPFNLLKDLPNNASATFLDDGTLSLGATPPAQAQNTLASLLPADLGYYEFVPGGASGAKVASPSFSAGHGWVVDAPGTVSIASGTWTFTNNLKASPLAAATKNGTADLVIGMWKVDDSGAAIGSPIIDPTVAAPTGGDNTVTNVAIAAGYNYNSVAPAGLTTTTVTGVPAISLATGEHLYVQYWRRQKTIGTLPPLNTPTVTLASYDGVSKIAHPTANAFPGVPALGTVAARTNVTPQLSATFSDTDVADTGTISFQLCSDSPCSAVLQSNTSASGIARGAAATWTPTALGDGTYYWRASALDSAGNSSGWPTSTGSFVVDTVAPATPALISPVAAAHANATQLTATYSDPDPGAGDSGTLGFQLCSNSSCSSVVASGSSSTVTTGNNGTYTPTGVPDGSYYWRARGQDAAGNESAWTATRSVTLDTVAPPTPTLGGVTALVNTPPQLSTPFADPVTTDTDTIEFEVCNDTTCSTAPVSSSSVTVTNGATATFTPPTSLADGTYYVRVRAGDSAGNQSVWSNPAGTSFRLDATAPVLVLGTVAARTAATPQLSTTYTDNASTGTLSLQLCTNSSCTSVSQSTSSSSGLASGTVLNWTPASLPDRTYYWRARAVDAAGNQSAWSVGTFVVDSTPPSPPSPVGNVPLRARTTPDLRARVDEPGDPGDSARVLFELCSDSTCGNVLAMGYSSTVPVGSVASWQGGALPDGTYYWRAFAEDLVGNQSAWSVTGQFVVDNVAPSVPATPAPNNGALVRTARLTGTFRSDDASDDGRLTFQVCADAACTNVVAGGTSGSVTASALIATTFSITGNMGSWTAGNLSDGSYFWRVRAEDEAGNSSDWSSTQSFTLDRTPPDKPRAFSAEAAGRMLTLRWRSPAAGGAIAGYTLLVNGHKMQILDASTLIVRVRLLDKDKRSFAIAAVDEAGNVGAPTAIFVPSTKTTAKHAQARTAPPLPARARKPRR